MKKILFFVESPLQLLNAFEANHHFQYEQYQYIIRLSEREETNRQLIKLVSILKLNETYIEYHRIRAKNKKIDDYLKFIFFSFRYIFHTNINKVYIGNYISPFMKIIMKQFSKSKIILLDDGAKTLTIHNSFSETKSYNLYTMYALNPYKEQTITQHNYEATQSLLNKQTKNQSKILFLGSSLSEMHIISKKYYRSLIQQIAKKYYDKTIIYIPHRVESREKLEQLKLYENIEIKRISYPVELYGLNEEDIPYKISSFYSTALFTMKKIYKIEVESFKFDYSNYENKEDIDKVYDYYKDEMSIIDLDSHA